MNEELIRQIVSRILTDPAFQALLQSSHEGTHEEASVVKPDGLVLLNYVPEFERVITALKRRYGADYTLSLCPSDQALVAKSAQLTLPEGMTWITPEDALNKTTWQKIILPACSPNTLAKAALGLRDNPLSELIGRSITEGTPLILSTEYLGFTAQTPKAYQELYEGYLQTVKSYGVVVCATLEEGCPLIKGTVRTAQSSVVTPAGQSHRTSHHEKREEVFFDKKFLGDKQVYGLPERSRVLVKRGTVISPLARDTMKSRSIELRQEREAGRR